MNKGVLEVRGLRLGEGREKICVPIVAETEQELEKALDRIRLSADVSAAADGENENISWRNPQRSRQPWDMVEYRADYLDAFREGNDPEKLPEVLGKVRAAAGDLPVLFTVRTKAEGGCFDGTFEAYCAFLTAAADTGLVDLCDVELFAGGRQEDRPEEGDFPAVTELISQLHARHLPVVGSSHDFEKTPSGQEIIQRLQKMQEIGCDVTKIAVMPRSAEDVLTLMSASVRMYERYADRPLITMSMGPLGRITRLACSLTGSALTFASAGRTSAPGQMEASFLRRYIDI